MSTSATILLRKAAAPRWVELLREGKLSEVALKRILESLPPDKLRWVRTLGIGGNSLADEMVGKLTVGDKELLGRFARKLPVRNQTLANNFAHFFPMQDEIEKILPGSVAKYLKVTPRGAFQEFADKQVVPGWTKELSKRPGLFDPAVAEDAAAAKIYKPLTDKGYWDIRPANLGPGGQLLDYEKGVGQLAYGREIASLDRARGRDVMRILRDAGKADLKGSELKNYLDFLQNDTSPSLLGRAQEHLAHRAVGKKNVAEFEKELRSRLMEAAESERANAIRRRWLRTRSDQEVLPIPKVDLPPDKSRISPLVPAVLGGLGTAGIIGGAHLLDRKREESNRKKDKTMKKTAVSTGKLLALAPVVGAGLGAGFGAIRQHNAPEGTDYENPVSSGAARGAGIGLLAPLGALTGGLIGSQTLGGLASLLPRRLGGGLLERTPYISREGSKLVQRNPEMSGALTLLGLVAGGLGGGALGAYAGGKSGGKLGDMIAGPLKSRKAPKKTEKKDESKDKEKTMDPKTEKSAAERQTQLASFEYGMRKFFTEQGLPFEKVAEMTGLEPSTLAEATLAWAGEIAQQLEQKNQAAQSA